MSKSNLTDADFQADGREWVLDLKRRIELQPDGPARRRAQRLYRLTHGAMEELEEMAVDLGLLDERLGLRSGGDGEKD